MTITATTIAAPAVDVEEIAPTIGDEILRTIAASEKVQKVSASTRGEIRGWTMGGRVD